MNEPAGYFIWTPGLRGPQRQKVNADMIRYQYEVLARHALSVEEWQKLTLEQLAEKYPCPAT